MSSQDPKNIQISLQAMAKMIKFDLSMTGTETIGLLIGNEVDGILYVEDVRLGQQTGNAVHVEVSESELIQATIEISERDDGQVIVGWIHTHPNLSAFLSPTDIRTQSLYQSLMPNAIAIVIDPVQYGKTGNLTDLDLKVFRVANGQAKEQRYTFIKTVEFGLRTFITGESEVKVHGEMVPSTYELRVPNKDMIKKLRGRIDENKDKLQPEDVDALNVWLELTEAIESGDVKEVPVEVESIVDTMNNSLHSINDEIIRLRQEIEYRKNTRTLFGILFGVLLEVVLFYYLFNL